jgi:hypothetical protein
VLGPHVPSLSSLSDSSNSAVNVQNPPQDEKQQEMVTNAVFATTRTTMSMPMDTKRTNSAIAHEDWIRHDSLIFHVDFEHGGDACGVLQLAVAAYNPTGLKGPW